MLGAWFLLPEKAHEGACHAACPCHAEGCGVIHAGDVITSCKRQLVELTPPYNAFKMLCTFSAGIYACDQIHLCHSATEVIKIMSIAHQPQDVTSRHLYSSYHGSDILSLLLAWRLWVLGCKGMQQ